MINWLTFESCWPYLLLKGISFSSLIWKIIIFSLNKLTYVKQKSLLQSKRNTGCLFLKVYIRPWTGMSAKWLKKLLKSRESSMMSILNAMKRTQRISSGEKAGLYASGTIKGNLVFWFKGFTMIKIVNTVDSLQLDLIISNSTGGLKIRFMVEV
jgi:hypothetical protein